MLETVKSNRVIFPKGKQREFLTSVQKRMKVTQKEMARLAGITLRSFSDWRGEKILLPLSAVKLFVVKSGITSPKNVKIVSPYWYTSKGGSAAAKVVLRKYGRLGGEISNWRKKWATWWKQQGRFLKFSPVGVSKPFNKPGRSSELAEFIGIILGDGSISKHQITLTLHSVDDRIYATYIQNLIQKLFNVTVKSYKQKRARALTISISRTELVQWFERNHGLRIGNKVTHQVDVPLWIKESMVFSKACTRGLFDTDGCIFLHTYRSSGKIYAYKKLTFTNFSKPLVYFFYETLLRSGFHPRLARKSGEEREVRLDSKDEVKRYFKIIGSHNQKFLKRMER